MRRERAPCAFAATDPVALHQLDRLRPIETVEVVDQAVGIGGDAHHPLAHVALEHRVVADVAAALGGDLFVREDCAEAGAPVDRGVGEVSEPMAVEFVVPLGGTHLRPRRARRRRPRAGCELGFEFCDRARTLLLVVVPGAVDLQEDPLRPLVERLVCGADAAASVVSESEASQLAAHVGDVRLGVHPGVHPGGDRMLLGREAEAVVPERVQHVEAAHPLVAGEHVGADVAERVANVKSRARRVGKHVEHEQLLPACDLVGLSERASGVRGLERSLSFPAVLPTCLDLGCKSRRVSVHRGVSSRAGGGRRLLAHGCAILIGCRSSAHETVGASRRVDRVTVTRARRAYPRRSVRSLPRNSLASTTSDSSSSRSHRSTSILR